MPSTSLYGISLAGIELPSLYYEPQSDTES